MDRWLGAGLAAVLSVVTLVLAVTGRLTLYIAPETVWFASAAAVVTLIGAVWSCALPLGAEDDHGHDHEDAGPRRLLGTAATASAGAVASVFVIAALLLPPASLSVELAMSRDQGAGALFAGADEIVLGQADTTTFGVGDWASVAASTTRPENYDGAPVTLVGFVTPSGDDPDQMRVTRLVITHCVIDAQPAAVPVAVMAWASDLTVGDWVSIEGTVRVGDGGMLTVEPSSIERIAEPRDPYEY